MSSKANKVRAETMALRVHLPAFGSRSKRSIRRTSLFAAFFNATGATSNPANSANRMAMYSAFTTLYRSVLDENLATYFLPPSSTRAFGRAPPMGAAVKKRLIQLRSEWNSLLNSFCGCYQLFHADIIYSTRHILCRRPFENPAHQFDLTQTPAGTSIHPNRQYPCWRLSALIFY